MGIWCDRVIIGGVLSLVLFTPLAFGAVHPWIFSVAEGTVFLLVIIWMGKLVVLARNQESRARDLASQAFRLPTLSFILPLPLFVALILFQLLPLPPSLLRLLSPSTYELYTKSLPGWPDSPPYGDLSFETPDPQKSQTWNVLPTPDEVKKGIPVPYTGTPSASPLTPHASRLPPPAPWLPLSIAPSLTRTDLLKLIAYAAFFSLVLLYPIGPSGSQPQAEARFIRSVLLGVLLSGLLVASVGFAQRFLWNGKILWFFVPYDWGVPHPGGPPRASGPFVNPDHFANHLSLIFPLAVTGALFRTFIMPKRIENALRIFCGFAAFILFLGILLSLSRAAWIGALLEVSILFWIFSRMPGQEKPSLLKERRSSLLHYALIGLCVVLVMGLLFVGPSGRRQVDILLEETVLQDIGLRGRASIWKETLGMVKDFPIFGVGLGSWPELFPRYKSPPWSSTFYRETHNDYLELLAEAGIVGFGLLAWFFWEVGRRLLGSLGLLYPKALPVFAALLLALGVMAFHEFFDFNLQIPANALLFTLLLALALRMTSPAVASQSLSLATFRLSTLQAFLPVSIGVVAFILLNFALNQEMVPYPHNSKEPASVTEAREFILSHPTRSSGHLFLLRALEDKAPPSWQLNELGVALWLDPTSPYVRDLYASALLRIGRKEQGLKELARSVFYSPSLSMHFYSGGRFFDWLSHKEKEAVEEGFKKALAYEDPGAIEGLAGFYARLGRFSEQATVYEEAALRVNGTTAKANFLLNAGLAYVRAGEEKKAEMLFRKVALLMPKDPKGYHFLATSIYAPKKDLGGAHAVISEGIKNGADPFSLYITLADAAGKAGDREEEKSALLKALKIAPSSFEVTFRLGVLYLQENNFGRAAFYFNKATDLNSRSADAFYHLAMAEEGRYNFFSAEKAYAHAIKLAPENSGLQRRYDEFKRKAAEGREGKG